MDDKIRQRMYLIELISQSDVQYRQMLDEIRILEKRYDAVLRTLPSEQQDVVCDFVSQCEGMSEYLLQLACTYMRFPK